MVQRVLSDSDPRTNTLDPLALLLETASSSISSNNLHNKSLNLSMSPDGLGTIAYTARKQRPGETPECSCLQLQREGSKHLLPKVRL